MGNNLRRGAVGVAAAALALTGLSALSPSLASAEPEVPSGPYNYVGHSVDGSSNVTGTWVFTPCGPTCTAANGEDGGKPTNWQFQLNDGRWTFVGTDSIPCPGSFPGTPDVGAALSRSINASFDAATLAGQWQGVQTTACGPFAAGDPIPAWNFELNR